MSSALYLLVWAGTLADQLGGLRWAGMGAGVCLLGYLLAELAHQRRALGLLFLGMTITGMAAVALAADPLATFLQAWRRGATYAAFFLALGVLRDAAETSALVRRCGRHLVAQPPGRRYAALTAGGHLFSIILSYGAIELFGAMVARADASGGDAAGGQVRTQRMMMAVYRGFAVMNCWSPLNIMTVVVSAAVPAADMHPLIPAAFVIAVVMLGIGWALDAHTASGAEPALPRPADGWAIHLRIIALVALVMALAEAVAGWFGAALSTGVTAAVPAVGTLWLATQASRMHRPGLMAGWLARRALRFYRRIPSFRGEATVLGAGGFLGGALGAVLPASGLAGAVGALPPVLVPLLVAPVLMAAGMLGLNPIVLVAVIGAAVPDPAALGVPPAALAFACMLGWGVAVGMTPMSASAITTARWVGCDPWTICTRLNRSFNLLAWLLASAAILAAHGLLGGALLVR